MNKIDQLDVREMLQNMLNREPVNAAVRNIIFWYDSDREFEIFINDFSFDNTKVVSLNGHNSFKVKYMIEIEDPESNFLVYAPFERPADRENWLLDIEKYAEDFSTDRAAYELRRMGLVEEELKPVIKKNLKFFDNEKRVAKLQSYAISRYTPLNFEIAIISALAKLKAPDLDELVRLLMDDWTNDKDTLVREIDKYGDINVLYDIIKQKFGYYEEGFSMDILSGMMMYTAFSFDFKGNLPDSLNRFKSRKLSEIVVFMGDLANNLTYRPLLAKMSKKYEHIFRVEEFLEPEETETLLKCDTFKIIDSTIIGRIVKGIQNGSEIYDQYIEYAKTRRSSVWYKDFEDEFNCLIHGLSFLKLWSEWQVQSKIEQSDAFFKAYAKDLYKIDFRYRKFNHYYDKIRNKDLLGSFNERIENTYVNSYLDYMAMGWSKATEQNDQVYLTGIEINKQWDFYHHFVSEYVESGDRVFVIISDAMRYEIAAELVNELIKERRSEVVFEAVEGILPSSTSYGMSVLLPHKEINQKEDKTLEIDGISTAGKINREKILKKVEEESVAINFEDMKHFKKENYKDAFTGKKLIYIYHNTIDLTGHISTPFDAAETAIYEIKNLVRNLVNNVSATKIIITADHGFIYQRSKLKEFDKLQKIKTEDILESDRRYLVAKDRDVEEGFLKRPFNKRIKTKDKLCIMVPKGAIRMKTQGSDGNFVHGGLMPQEIVIPVITYFDKRSDDYRPKKVEVQLTSTTRKLTNRISYLEFFQTESIGDKKLPLNLNLYLIDDSGQRISNEVMIIADRTSSVPNDRRFKEKFVLKDLKYLKEHKYYLVFEDDEETMNPIMKRIEFSVDLAISNDFGF